MQSDNLKVRDLELFTHPGEKTIQSMHSANLPFITPTGHYYRLLAIAHHWRHRIQTCIGGTTTRLDPFYEIQVFDRMEEVWRPIETSIFCEQDAKAAYQKLQAMNTGDSRNVRLVLFASEVVEF